MRRPFGMSNGQREKLIQSLVGKKVTVEGKKSIYVVVGMNHNYDALLIRDGKEDIIEKRSKAHPKKLKEVL